RYADRVRSRIRLLAEFPAQSAPAKRRVRGRARPSFRCWRNVRARPVPTTSAARHSFRSRRKPLEFVQQDGDCSTPSFAKRALSRPRRAPVAALAKRGALWLREALEESQSDAIPLRRLNARE